MPIFHILNYLQEKELEQARSEFSRFERMRAEMSQQEAQWREAYDLLLAENKKLKSSGSEALLASQWRQRYETCLKEKDVLELKLSAAAEKAVTVDGKYELKYRDLKESFRLYRKKAKEIFESQQGGPQGVREWKPLYCLVHPLLSHKPACPLSIDTLGSDRSFTERGFKIGLPEKFDGELFDFRYSCPRAHGRRHWYSVAIYTRRYREN